MFTEIIHVHRSTQNKYKFKNDMLNLMENRKTCNLSFELLNYSLNCNVASKSYSVCHVGGRSHPNFNKNICCNDRNCKHVINIISILVQSPTRFDVKNQ